MFCQKNSWLKKFKKTCYAYVSSNELKDIYFLYAVNQYERNAITETLLDSPNQTPA